MHQSKLKRISLAVCLALMPFSANAAGLGKLTVMSGLGEPLNAEIAVLATPEELASLTAAIAPESAYVAQGIERTALHNAIKIDVKKRADGTSVLKLSSNQPITDPFLDMIIQMDWQNAQLLREFTLLLDPPGYANQNVVNPTVKVASQPPKPFVSNQPSVATAEGNVKKSSHPKQLKTRATPVETPVDRSEAQSHTIVRGDSLSTIAKEMQVDGVNLDQMLVGLYQANKNAFDGNNMNRLKVGQIIRTPSAEVLQALNKDEASKEVHLQSADWHAYRNKLAGVVAGAPALSEDASNQSTSGKIATKAEDKAAPAINGRQDVVKLSKSDTAAGKAASGDVKAMQDKLTALQEEMTARENAVKEADIRTSMLEKQIQDMQKLLAIKSQALAEMQKNAATPAASIQVPVVPSEAKVHEAEKSKVTTTTPTPAATDASKPVLPAKESGVHSKVVIPAQVQVTPPQEVGLLDGLMTDPVVFGGAGGALALLGGAWLYLRNKRKRGLDRLEKSILTSGGMKANTVFGNTIGSGTGSGHTSFLTDFSQNGSGMIDTHDVDPIAEAEVYMAYGRDTQAEEILRDAISKEPKRHDLHLKLLEVYAARKDLSAFETVAGELYSTLGTSDPVWTKAAEMGRILEPNNPLYQSVTTAIPDAVSAKLESSDFADAEVLSEENLDFSLGSEAKPTQEAQFLVSTVVDEPLSLGANESALNIPQESLEETKLGLDESLYSTSLDEPLDFSLQQDNKVTQDEVPDSGNTNLDFDVAEMSLPQVEAESAVGESIVVSLADNAVDEAHEHELSFDLPEFDLPEIDTEHHVDQLVENETSDDLQFPSFDMTASAESQSAPLASEDEIVKQPDPVALDADLDFPLDLNLPLKDIVLEDGPLGSLDMSPVADSETASMNAPTVDLSGISFNLDEDDVHVNEAVGPSEVSTVEVSAPEEEVSTEAESSEVETKLDLVTAYMDMGDNEGAKELIEEVLKEGGPQQRVRAKDILASLT